MLTLLDQILASLHRRLIHRLNSYEYCKAVWNRQRPISVRITFPGHPSPSHPFLSRTAQYGSTSASAYHCKRSLRLGRRCSPTSFPQSLPWMLHTIFTLFLNTPVIRPIDLPRGTCRKYPPGDGPISCGNNLGAAGVSSPAPSRGASPQESLAMHSYSGLACTATSSSSLSVSRTPEPTRISLTASIGSWPRAGPAMSSNPSGLASTPT